MAMLDAWSQRRRAQAVSPADAVTGAHPVSAPEPSPAPSTVKIEAGLRVCPRCGKPVHLSAVVCRECGAHVPKR
jgi:uncharacterized protein (UPF0212 family)